VILSSDNGPVVDDGYLDQAVELLGDHNPSGGLRGGKYSAFEAGTRIPFVVRWPGKVKQGVSDALVSQIDLFATLATLTGQQAPAGAAPDSRDALGTWLGTTSQGRSFVIGQSTGTLTLIADGFKFIAPSKGAKYNRNTCIELGHDTLMQLYNLREDSSEHFNIADIAPDKRTSMKRMLDSLTAIQ